MAAMGHLRPYAASSVTGCRAPIPAVREAAIEPPGSTRKTHSWPAPVDSRAGQGADIRAGFQHMPIAGSRQCVEQRLCVFEIRCVQAFGEPAVDRREEIASLSVATLVAVEPGEA